ncbi:tryptophan 7-halogenase [Pendulispora rubella]|uniref:Tryptophan 7-halogenase n=1 Tax=Pendulispora rubella TaxID=2741070 RepID=A0ABZ2L1Y3_9BACT
MSEEEYDLIVIGGGPGGSTAASFVAMAGHRVLLLEREWFPRHQIGESLLPVTIHGICRMLGVDGEIERANFMRKHGGTFRWGKSQEPWTFSFANTWMLSGQGLDYAFQVERSRFDEILLRNAGRKGVDVREGHTVIDTLREAGRTVGVRFVDAAGKERRARAPFVIDAGGHQSKLHQYAGERVFAKFFQNIALYGYFEHGKRMPSPDEGNILCAAFDEGWFWYIPLSPTLTSVGAVVSKEQHAETFKQGYERAFQSFVDACPLIKEYLDGARRVTEGPYGIFRVRKDYSYCNTQFWAPGLLLVGDAACFIDPVFSSGVHLTTYAALLGARTVNTVLRGTLDAHTCMTEFETRYRNEYAAFYDFLVGFYDMLQDEKSYFWSARKVLGTNEADQEAFVRLVAGGATAAEDFLEMSGAKREFLKEYVTSRTRQETAEEFFARYSNTSFDAKSFTRNLRRGRAEVLAQATQGEARTEDPPLRDGGLVPSRDGFHWVAPPKKGT